MIKLGTGNVTLYLGDKKVKAAWLGTEKVYPNSFLELSASSLSFAAAGQTQTLGISVEDGQTWSISGTPAGWSLSASSGTGSATVTVTAPNNTTASAKTGTLVVASEDLTASCALSQAAGVQSTEYTNWVTNSVTISANTTSVAAAGGSAILSAKASQSRSKITKWNGIETGRTTETQTPDVSTSATYSKVSGSGSVSGRTVTFPNNMSTNALSGVYRATYSGKTADVTISQAAGAKVYGAWQNVSLTIDTTSFAASGGTSAMRVNVKRTWTWNGVAGSGGTETSTSSLASPSTSDNIASVSGNTLTVGSLGTTFKASKTITVSAQTAHDATRVSATVTQAANYVTSINSLKTRTLTYSQIGAAGGTSDCQLDQYPGAEIDRLWSCTFASGATGTATDADAVGNFRQLGIGYSWTGPSGTITSLNGTTGAVTATSRGTTVGNAITVTVNAIQNVVFDNPSSVGGSTTPVLQQPATGTCSQAGNYVESLSSYSKTEFSYNQVSAGGGTANPVISEYGVLQLNFTSGAKAYNNGTIPSTTYGKLEYSTTYSMTPKETFSSINSNTGAVTVSSKGTIISNTTTSNTITRTGVSKWIPTDTYNSAGTVTNTSITTATCSQAANTVSYGTPTGRTLSVATIPASGGTISSGTLGGTITQSRTFTSGVSDTLTNPAVSASSYSAAISGANLGTTVKPRTAKGTLTYYYTCNGKQGSCSAAVFQAANYLTGLTVTPSAFSYSVAPAAAGNSTPSNSGSDTQTFTFASGTTSTSGNISGTYYTVSSSQKYSWPGAAGFFSSLNTSNGVVTTTTAGTTPIPSQLAGPLVTKTLTMTYTPTGALGAGTTLTKSGTKTAYPQKGINKKTVSSSSCVPGTTKLRTYYVWTSGANGGYSDSNSYSCGYRVTLGVGVSIVQSGIMVAPVINTLRAYSCWGNTVQHQGTSYVDFPNPSFGENAATLTLNQSETSNHSSITYVLYQCNITYTDSGGTGAIPNYVWSNAVTYSGSLAIYTKANAPNASVTVSAATRSTTSLQEDADTLLRQAESAGIELTDEIKAELTAIADGKE